MKTAKPGMMKMKRIPEPELMDSPEQVDAYAGADFDEPNRLFTETLLMQFGADLPESANLLDLGCGPGDICVRLARALPGWRLTGLDAGPNMLERARKRIKAEGLEDRIELVLARLPDHGLSGRGHTMIVSNSLLHHLPDPMSLWKSLPELAGPETRVQIMDLMRPESASAARALVKTHAAGEPDILREDFHNSLLAAWRPGEVREQLREAGIKGLEVFDFTSRHWIARGTIRR